MKPPFSRWIALCIIASSYVYDVPPAIADTVQQPTPQKIATAEQLAAIKQYIKDGWQTLRRSNKDFLKAPINPKHPNKHGKWPVYIPAHENPQAVIAKLPQLLPPQELAQLELRPLSEGMP